MTRRALFISPHLDDAAFSCPEAVLRCVEDGWQVTLATIFTASVAHPSGFALACQLDKGLAADVDYMALRRDEDAAFARALGAEVRHLPLAEAPHRGYHDVAALFGPPRADDPAPAALAGALDMLWAEIRPDLCFAPVGIGVHVDHALVVDAVTRLEHSARGVPVLRYADQPYAMKNPVRAMQAVGRLDAYEYRMPPRPQSRARVLDAVAAYATQLAFQFGSEAAMRRDLDTAFFAGTPLWSRAPRSVLLDSLLVPAEV